MNMKNRKKFLALFATSVLSLTSCNLFSDDTSENNGSSTSPVTSPTTPVTTPSSGKDPVSTPSVSSPTKPEEVDGVPVTEIPAGYNLSWHDEFNGNSLNANFWEQQIGNGTEYGPGDGWGNGEAQWYQAQNTTVTDGNLIITAKKESVGGKAYTSSRIRTLGKVSMKYGRIEARMALPEGQGLWPAFWMLPEANTPYGEWPHSGEIDIMEARGRVIGESTSALHFSTLEGHHTYQTNTYHFPEGRNITQWNTYGIEWDRDTIKYFVNDDVYFTLDSSAWTTQAAPGNSSAPFDHEFHILINFAIGGHFDNYVLPDAGFTSADLKVDYVRIFTKK